MINKNAIAYLKSFANKYFVTAFTGMAYGLFVTLIAGLIIAQLGMWTNMPYLKDVGKVAAMLMGAGIGGGIAYALRAPTLVILSCLVAGMLGAHSEAIIGGNYFINVTIGDRASIVIMPTPGNPVSAYLSSVFAYRLATWICGVTRLDILLVPLTAMLGALLVCLYLAPYVIQFTNQLSELIHEATTLQPLAMGVVIAVVMGILLTLPTSSAAIAISIGLGGLAGGASVVGCAAHMIGFAAASFRDNGFAGLIAQGLGTSMLQIPNIVKNPLIMLPAIVASAIVGALATTLFQLQCTASGAGMGTAGLVGVFAVIDASTPHMSTQKMWFAIALLFFILPTIIAVAVAALLRRYRLIKDGDMKI